MNETLVSSVSLSAPNTDPKLLMPFDLAFVGDDIWVTTRSSSLICKYSRKGCLQGTISVPIPTGICVSISSSSSGHKRKKCQTTEVYIASANGSVYKTTSSSTSAAIYVSPGGTLTGIAHMCGKLYVVENQNGFVAVYDTTSTTTPIKMSLALVDKPLFAVGYKPYGIRALCDKIYITYTNGSARQGSGYVDVYEPDKCRDLIRLINRQNLSSSYGLSLIDDTLVVGNSGSGYLSKFLLCEDKAVYTTNVRNSFSGDIIVDGIMGMISCDDTIYYVASQDSGKIGALGRIHTNNI